MDIKEIIHPKGSKEATAAANGAAQDLYLLQSSSQARSFMSKTGSERVNSPYDMNRTSNNMRYPSPTAMQNPLPMLLQPYRPENEFDNYMLQQENNGGAGRQLSGGGTTQKAFPCTTCGKGFTRRGDLIRHERIHSGVRPHVCDHPGCHKQFIQRSALTVHQRTHTGEKPHMCERCGKPFSDSSALARHRRIHSGKRPYKCPYADCQKTFTRRSTLTRHQSHHMGTVEESVAATAAVLATRGSSNCGGRQHSYSEKYRYPGDYQYDFTSYIRPPSVLEPPANMEQCQPGSANGSPRMGTIRW